MTRKISTRAVGPGGEQKGQKVLLALLALLALFASLFTIPSHDCYHGWVMEFSQVMC
jgi:hypothetical protein